MVVCVYVHMYVCMYFRVNMYTCWIGGERCVSCADVHAAE